MMVAAMEERAVATKRMLSLTLMVVEKVGTETTINKKNDDDGSNRDNNKMEQ